jgi:cytochrome b6-f complex iron-sulfur subunit
MMSTMGLQCGVQAPQRATFGCDVKGLRPAQAPVRAATRQVTRASSSAFAGAEVPDMNKRTTMNLLLVGALGLPITAMAGPFIYFFFPKGAGSSAGGLTAKDALGNDVKASAWLATHKKGDRSLTQGLKADATYLIVNDDGEIEKYGLNAVCTHLGCVVPWNGTENKFKCPCHGSQYNFQGKVVRGPAPLSLALAHCDVKEDMVVFTPWTEKDFRTGLDPWWA